MTLLIPKRGTNLKRSSSNLGACQGQSLLPWLTKLQFETNIFERVLSPPPLNVLATLLFVINVFVRFKTSCEGHTHLKTQVSKQSLVSQDKMKFGLGMCPNIEVLGVKVGPSFWGMNYMFPVAPLDGGYAKLKMSISNRN